MKSKVIVFCVWLFCSQFVESNPFSDDLVGHRAHQPNVPRQFHNGRFAQTQNGNENTQKYLSNHGGQKYDGFGNNNPISLTPGPMKEMLVDLGSPTDGHVLDSYPIRPKSYPSGIINESQPKLNNNQYRNQNWQSQNQYGRSLSSGGAVTHHERRESFRGPGQYIPTGIRQFYQTNTNHPLRTDQYPLVNSDSNRYAINSASQLGSTGSIPYKSLNKASRIAGGNRYGDGSASQGPINSVPFEIYNGPVITDTSANKFEKIREVEKYDSLSGSSNPVSTDNNNPGSFILTNNWAKNNGNSRYINNFGSHSGSRNTVPVQRYNDGSSIISGNMADNTGSSKYADYRSGISDLAPANTAGITEVLSEKLGNTKYLDTYGSDSGSSNLAPVNKYTDGTKPVVTDSLTDNTENSKYVDNFGSDYRKSDITPANTAANTEIFSEKSKYTDAYGLDSTSNNNAPVNSYNIDSAIISDNLSKRTGNNWYTDNYGSDFGLNKYAPTHYNNAPEQKHGNNKRVNDYGSDIKSGDIVPVSYNNAATLTDTLTKYSGINRYADNNGYDYGSNNPIPVDTNDGNPVTGNSKNIKYLDKYPTSSDYLNQGQHIYQQLSKEIDFEQILSSTALRDALLKKGGFVLVKSDGTVQYVDQLDPSIQNNPNYRVVHTKGNYREPKDAAGDEAYTTQSPAYVPSNSDSKSVPVDEQKIFPNVNLSTNDNNPQTYQSDYNSSPTTLSSIVLDDYSSTTPLIPIRPDYIQSLLVSNETDSNPASTTSPLIVPDYNTSPTLLIQNTADGNQQTPLPASSNFPNVATTPPSTDTTYLLTADDKIPISLLDLAKDNVSDDSPVTSTTANPVIGTDTFDAVTQSYNKQDEARDNIASLPTDTSVLDTDQKYATTTVAPSTSVLPISNSGGDEIITNGNSTQSNTDIVTDQAIDNAKYLSQIATYNSLSNTDVPAKYDDFSPYTTDSSIQSDVYTGDSYSTPGDNPLESTELTNDLIITLNTTSDSEDDTIKIIIEVSESTDDADSSSDEKKIVVSIEAQDSSDDDSKISNKDDSNCKKDKTTGDTDKSKNLEIDLSNVSNSEPTVWFKTTDEEFIDKLTSNNDTKFDVIYFFKMYPQVLVEKENQTTKYCNGTVVIESTVTTWQYKDDPSPKIEKNTKIINPE